MLMEMIGIHMNGNNPAQSTTLGKLSSRLRWFDELPAVLKFNKYVRSGYRAGYSCQECACSVFQYHNETGNVWVHLLPALCMLVALLVRTLQPWPLAKLQFYKNFLSILICLCGSVIYHTFMANHTNYRRWLLIDVCCVFLLFMSGVDTSMYWGLYCYPRLRTGFITAYYMAGLGCIVGGLRARSNVQRALPLLALLGVRLACLCTRALLGSGSPEAIRRYLCMEAAAVTGAVVNVLRVPEKWLHDEDAAKKGIRKAGPFDYWLNSHQIMHILVTIAMVQNHLGATADYHYFVSKPNPCSL